MKKAAVIHDLSGFGKCSLTAAIPVLSALGVQCCPVATAVLTGLLNRLEAQGRAFLIRPLEPELPHLEKNPELASLSCLKMFLPARTSTV